MANVIYNSFKATIMAGNMDLDTNTIWVGLLTSAHTANADTQHVWSNISANEVSGTAYVAGGTALTGVTITIDNTDDEGVFDAGDITYVGSYITAYYAALYEQSTSALICSIDFGSAQSTTNGTFQIQWNSEGILNLN